jgi:hypothetical protein
LKGSFNKKGLKGTIHRESKTLKKQFTEQGNHKTKEKGIIATIQIAKKTLNVHILRRA